MCKSPYLRDYITDGHISLRRYHIGDEFALYEGINESIAELTRWGFYHVGFTLADAVEAEKIGAALVQIKLEDDGSYSAVYELKPEYLI